MKKNIIVKIVGVIALLIVGRLMVYVLFGPVGGGYDSAGWEFLRNHMKSPSTAELVSTVSKSDMKDALRDMNITLPSCISDAEMYTVDAQNGWGATVRESHVVFFKNGKPCHGENAKSVNKQAEYNLSIALRINCGCD